MLEKYLSNERISSGLHYTTDLDYILARRHKYYDFGDGFSLFVECHKNWWISSCGFFETAVNVFQKCKQSIDDLIKSSDDLSDFSLNAMVHERNKLSRFLVNALNFKFIGFSKSIPETRYYQMKV